jgi:hypothetical protein
MSPLSTPLRPIYRLLLSDHAQNFYVVLTSTAFTTPRLNRSPPTQCASCELALCRGHPDPVCEPPARSLFARRCEETDARRAGFNNMVLARVLT